MNLKYLNTIKYLETRQIYYLVKKRLFGLRNNNIKQSIVKKERSLPVNVEFINCDGYNTGESIKNGTFCFLNRCEELGFLPDWNRNDLPLLWLYNLYYFKYLDLLDVEKKVTLCKDWIYNNKEFGKEKPQWHPYPVSLRIVSWIKNNLRDHAIDRELYRHALILCKMIEYDLPGNHLFENAKALIFAGVYFEGEVHAKIWINKGFEILNEQTPVQILQDGGFFERSPMYHAIVLEGYLDLINILPEKYPEREGFISVTSEMLDFQNSMTHPDAGISLFSDAGFKIAPETEMLCSYTQNVTGYSPRRKNSFPDTGYYIHGSKDLYLVIDGGQVGPDHIPGHGHADIFSYELSLKGKRIIVDSGVYEYEAGEMREYVRSTRAHNTVVVDDTDQAEMWGSFRVARRYKPYDVNFSYDAYGSTFSGKFGGYAKLIGDGIIHLRRIRVDNSTRKMYVTDTIEGRGTHSVKSYIHLQPGATLERIDNGMMVYFEDIKMIIDNGKHDLHVEEGWYCPEFGLRFRNPVLVIGGDMKLPCTVEYAIAY